MNNCKDDKPHDFQYNHLYWCYQCVKCGIKQLNIKPDKQSNDNNTKSENPFITE